jgi:hypothetical protein
VLGLSRPRTYGAHSGVWLRLADVQLKTYVVTLWGRRRVRSAGDVGEGSILHTIEGDWLEVFLADPARNRYFCETVAHPDTDGILSAGRGRP